MADVQRQLAVVPGDCELLTTTGPRRLDEIQVDVALAHPQGRRNRLTGLSPGPVEQLFAVTLGDGTAVEAAASTSWPVLIGPSSELRIVNTAKLADLLAAGPAVRVLPTVADPGMSESDLPLDGWLLGTLIGDGYLRWRSVEIVNSDPEMHDGIAAALPPGVLLTRPRVGLRSTSVAVIAEPGGQNVVLHAIRDLGLAGKRAWEKHLPEMYLQADKSVRIALLQGLCDTDGSIDKLGRVEFSSASQRLAEDVQALVQSLGGRASLGRKTDIFYTSPWQPKRTPARDAFRLTNIRVPEFSPFRLSRKVARLKPMQPGRQWTVKSVVPTRVAPTITIEVSDDAGMFVLPGHVTLASRAA